MRHVVAAARLRRQHRRIGNGRTMIAEDGPGQHAADGTQEHAAGRIDASRVGLEHAHRQGNRHRHDDAHRAPTGARGKGNARGQDEDQRRQQPRGQILANGSAEKVAGVQPVFFVREGGQRFQLFPLPAAIATALSRSLSSLGVGSPPVIVDRLEASHRMTNAGSICTAPRPAASMVAGTDKSRAASVITSAGQKPRQ